jgi:hypothetical protein
MPAKENTLLNSQRDSTNVENQEQGSKETHYVHGGMLKTAQLMGLPGKPVHTAVAKALRSNRGYGKH